MRKSLILLVFAAVVFTAAACQPNPEGDIVVQKEDGVIELKESDGAVGIADYEAPESWKEEATFDNSSIQINIDAKIEYPDVSTVPSYIVDEKAGLPQEVIDALIGEFFGTAKIYSSDKPRTKAELQQEILDMQLAIQKTKNDPDAIGEPEFMQEMVEEMQEELKTAPETVDADPLEIDANKIQKDGSVMLDGIADVPGRGKMSLFYAFNTNRSTASMLCISSSKEYLLKTLDNEDLNASKSIAREEAIAEAKSLLERVGIRDMKFEHAEFAKLTKGGGDKEKSGTYGYIVHFVHEVDGIPAHSNVVQTASLLSQDEYKRKVSYEYLSIGVTKDGVLDFSWFGHFETGKKEAKNVALLPFEEIQKVFAQYMLYAHSYLDDPETVKYIKELEKERTFYVHSIKLGYGKSAVKDQPGVYRLVPVWNFYAYKVDKNGVKDYDNWACMSIDAATGSIFN